MKQKCSLLPFTLYTFTIVFQRLAQSQDHDTIWIDGASLTAQLEQ